MSDIKTFNFNKDSFDEIRKYQYGINWPVVYIAENGKEVYIGETVNAFNRSKQHYENPERRKLKTIHILTDGEFNKSATLDIESWLIQYMAADQQFTLQNGNSGLKNHNYFDKEKYKAKFELAWEKMRDLGLAKSTLIDLKNTDLFKYSPYKSLTEDQFVIARKIYKELRKGDAQTYIIHGKPGTGKTILATYLFKFLKEQEETKDLSIALIVPMVSLRHTIKKVFSKIKGLSASMVVGPGEVGRRKYDLVIVDEAHRLQRRRNIPNYGSFDATTRQLGLGKDATQLDWIMKTSKHQIFFYDENQSVRPSDIRKEDFKELNAQRYILTTQMRVEAGEEYLKFIEDFFDGKAPEKTSFGNYDFKLFDNIHEIFATIKKKDGQHGLARMVAGYAWPWNTRDGDMTKYDIEIDGLKAVWNSTSSDWVNSKNAINEVGCIHTVQGYDLNYVGVIIGAEFGYNPEKQSFFVDREKYFDQNGYAGVQDPSELEQYIKNIYKTILTRGIKGTYVYICDENLRDYFGKMVSGQFVQNTQQSVVTTKVKSPYTNGEMLKIPLVGSAPCGSPLLGEENIEEYIDVTKSKIRSGSKYFIVRAEGDSMNKAGINDGDLVLCRYGEKGETGDRVVALLGGENVTIKYYDKRDGRRILLPKSTNPKHQPIIPEEGDSVQGVVQEILEDY